MYKLTFFLSLVVCLNYNKVYAQQIVNLSINTIGFSKDGFTSNIRKIIEDKNKFLWFSTEDALCKFDGIHVTRFIKDDSDKNGLLATDCDAMEYNENENYIYVLAAHKGLSVVNINTNVIEKKIYFNEIFGSKFVVSYSNLTRIGNRILIIANNNKFVFLNTNTQKVEEVGNVSLPPNLSIQCVFPYKGNLGIMLSNNTICYFESQGFRKMKELYYFNIDHQFLIAKYQIIDNKLLLATTVGMRCINLDNGNEVKIPIAFPGFPINYLNLSTSNIQLFDDNLFFSNSKGVFKYSIIDKKYYQIISNKNEDNENFLQSVSSFLYSNKQLWIGGSSGIAHINNLQPIFNPFYKSLANSSVKISQAYCMIPTLDQHVLVSSIDGLYKVDIQSNNIERILQDQFVYSMLQINKDLLLVSSTKKLIFYNGYEFLNAAIIFPELNVVAGDFFRSMRLFEDHKIVMLSNNQKGAYVWDMQMHTVEKFDNTTRMRLSDLLLKDAWVENKKKVFILTTTTVQILDFQKNEIKTVFDLQKIGNQSSDVLMDVCRQKDNYWLAAYGLGIIQLDSKFNVIKVLTIKDGIPDLGLFKIFNVADSLIVSTTDNGLVVYNTHQNKMSTFFEEDGLHSSCFNGLSGYQQGDTLYLGGAKGFTIFDTKKYATNLNAPQLYFNVISYDIPNATIDTTNLFIHSLEIPNNVIQTKISFTAINYSNPQRVQYWYRIKGLQDDWAELHNRNFIPLTIIPPGHYTVEVKAANEDGVECKPISLELYFIPKWYQTLLFKILLGLTIASILYGLYKYRINQIKQQQQIRHDIASDLHDDIGSLLNSAKVFNNLAKMQKNQNDYFVQVDESLMEASTSLRDMIWILDNSDDTISELMNRVKKFAIPITDASNIKFRYKINVSEKNNNITKTEKRNLFLILKEFINNSIKYAQCENIIIDFYDNKKGFILNLMDDGKGFDITKQTEGNGLRNITERAKQINCACEIITSEGKGVRIIIAKK